MEAQNCSGISGKATVFYAGLLAVVGLSGVFPALGYWLIGAAGLIFAYRRGRRIPLDHADYALMSASVAVVVAHVLFAPAPPPDYALLPSAEVLGSRGR